VSRNLLQRLSSLLIYNELRILDKKETATALSMYQYVIPPTDPWYIGGTVRFYECQVS